MMKWSWKSFDALSKKTLYELLALRQDVFIIEQQSLYHDIDGLDPACRHLLAIDDDGHLAGALRVGFPESSGHTPTMGRVVIRKAHRGQGLGRAMIAEGIARTRAEWSPPALRASVQHHLRHLYDSLGFAAVGDPYDDEGVLHIDMVLTFGADGS